MTNIKLIALTLQSIDDYLWGLIFVAIKFRKFWSISQKLIPAKVISKLLICEIHEI